MIDLTPQTLDDLERDLRSGMGFAPVALQQTADVIQALRAELALADELAKQAEHVCSVLKDDNGHAPIRLDQALAAYRATRGAA